ncbi:MAG: TlpA family protein disulfide reductase, partial [Prolixibacteraceae bacterium]
MKKILSFCCLMILGFHFIQLLNAQPYTLEIQLKNQPGNHIVLGSISGDNFHSSDTIILRRGATANTKKAKYIFPENFEPGMYRLIFGKTTYAKVMDEAPQQLDFIFNNEDIILETDFEKPEENLLVVLSEENRVWFEFLQREMIIQEKLDELEMEIEYYRKEGAGVSNSGNAVANRVTQYNTLQQQRDEFITEIITRNQELFATKLIQMYREPFLDGSLTKEERRKKFQKEYFNVVDFSDESLMNSSVYTDKVFQYLTSYNRPRYTKELLEKEYIKAVKVVLANVNENQNVYEFILSYLVHGFEVLKMENVLNYIADNYSGTTCQTDEKTTLERKLEAQKMKVGTTVPDFSLTDSEGFIVNLSDVQKEKTLLLFWASWCPHCNEMIPYIKKWAAGQDELEIIAISLDISKTEWQNAVEQVGVEGWTNLSDLKKWDGKVAVDYNVYATPTMFLIDEER